MSREYQPDEPFWMDESNPYARFAFQPMLQRRFSCLGRLIVACSGIAQLFLLALLIYLAIQSPLFWILVILLTSTVLASLFLRRNQEIRQAKEKRIQAQAKEQTRADILGSAIHIAGHPALSPGQPVVLGLRGSELSIYSYESAMPLHVLPVHDLQSVDPVVFDDEYIPHVGVIDSTAQSLQLTFPWRGTTITCGFRRMRGVRAIDWFHALQRARLEDKA